jgi:hypothetical protein
VCLTSLSLNCVYWPNVCYPNDFRPKDVEPRKMKEIEGFVRLEKYFYENLFFPVLFLFCSSFFKLDFFPDKRLFFNLLRNELYRAKFWTLSGYFFQVDISPAIYICQFIHWSVRPSVRPSVCWSVRLTLSLLSPPLSFLSYLLCLSTIKQ